MENDKIYVWRAWFLRNMHKIWKKFSEGKKEMKQDLLSVLLLQIFLFHKINIKYNIFLYYSNSIDNSIFLLFLIIFLNIISLVFTSKSNVAHCSMAFFVNFIHTRVKFLAHTRS